jgi:hypothetical protein
MSVLRRSKRRAPEARVQPSTTVIFRWDLDKTYLKSAFESLRQLVRIPFEKPEDKQTVPGVVPLIRGLREVATQAGRNVRIYFMSASPPQIARAIKEKLALDGIEYDGIVFKNQLQNIVRGKFRNLREHVGYKLTELLKSRREMPAGSREVLFGDDWESDPVIYSLYADILGGRVAAADLDTILEAIGVDLGLRAEARALAAAVIPEDVVTRIYINIERRTPPTNFRLFGTRLVPSFNYFQTAVCLFEDGHLTLPAVATIAKALIDEASYTPHRLANSLADVVRRGHVQSPSAIAVREYLRALDLLPPQIRASVRPSVWQQVSEWFKARSAVPPPATEQAINYQTLVSEWRAAR